MSKFGRVPTIRKGAYRGYRASSQSTNTPKLFSAEQSTLPTITLRSSKGNSFSAYVTAYVVSEGRYTLKASGWHSKRLLWYLSMVGAPGQGIALQALYSALVSTNIKEVMLEGVGEVALGTKAEYLQDEGYSSHWNYEQQRVVLPGGVKALHGILEPRSLTYADPQKALAMARQRRGEKAGSEAETPQKGKKESVTLSTASSGSGNADAWQQLAAQEQKPFFLLLVSGMHTGDEEYTAQLYRSFLDRRLPWPLKQEWALPLWQEAQTNTTNRYSYQIQKLEAWSYPAPRSGDDQETMREEELVPMISEAYLCRPEVRKIATQIRSLVVGSHESEVLPFLPRQEEERLAVEEREKIYA